MIEIFNALLIMDSYDRKKYIKNMTIHQREELINLMNLPKRSSQKSICNSLEIIAKVQTNNDNRHN